MVNSKLTKHLYRSSSQKYQLKRPKFTVDSFYQTKNVCKICKGTHFHCELQGKPNQPYYRIYGYQTRRVLWKIRCANASCYQPYGVILKPEFHDSAGE